MGISDTIRAIYSSLDWKIHVPILGLVVDYFTPDCAGCSEPIFRGYHDCCKVGRKMKRLELITDSFAADMLKLINYFNPRRKK